MGETHNDLLNRLVREGRITAYRERMKVLHEQGHARTAARLIARSEFPQLDDGVLVQRKVALAVPPPPRPAPLPVVATPEAQFESIEVVSKCHQLVTSDDNSTQDSPSGETTKTSEGILDRIIEKRIAEAKDGDLVRVTTEEMEAVNSLAISHKPQTVEAREVDQVITLAQFSGKKAVFGPEMVMWVFDNMDISDVTPEMAPSAGAWSYLMQLRKDKKMRSDFYSGSLMKLLPSKSQMEMETKFNDDGREQIDLIERIARAKEDSILPPSSKVF